MDIPHDTAFTRLVGCRLPLQQAAMGGVTTPELARAVGEAGALGMLAGVGLGGQSIKHAYAEATGGDTAVRVGVGFLVPFIDAASVEAAAEVASVVECFYGNPEPATVERIHRGAAHPLAAWQVGSVDEAKAAIDAGCDVLVVQGVEAGGHVRGTEPLARLLDQVRAATDLPLVAAGGIGDHAAAVAAFDAGADAVRVGTRFVAAAEADAHPEYVAALLKAGADDTVLSDRFSLGWPDAPHRVLRSCVEAGTEEPRLPLPPSRAYLGDPCQAALYAGRSVAAVTAVVPARAIVEELLAGP